MATIRNGTAALVVIDVQTDVMQAAWDREGVIGRISTLIDRARGENVPVIYMQHHDDDMEQESSGWQFVDGITPLAGEPVIAKRYQDSFVETGLSQLLEQLGVSQLVITGAQSMACIRATSHRALAEGYDLTLVEDAHTTDDLDYAGVELTAEQIIGYTNLCFQFTTYPGQESRVVSHDMVAFTTPAGVQETEHHVSTQ